MRNFTFQNTVKLYFGEGQIASLSNAIPKDSRILLTYGRGSIKQNGVYDQVMQALREFDVTEFAGIEANPKYETLIQAVKIAREKNINFLLAVGGGSVIDGTKFIAAAVPFKGDEWEDLVVKHAEIKSALPIGCVVTLPAAGSEMNGGAVISKKESQDKLVIGGDLLYPQFAILDPKITISLSARQTANGIIDAFVHVLEQYLTYPVNAPLQDRFAEAILLTLIEESAKVMGDLSNYEARANIMLCATMALNNLIGIGVPADWATHLIGHELTACFGLDHGQTLAIIMPSVMRLRRKQKETKLLQYGERVFGIKEGNVEERIDKTIAKTSAFFMSLGVKLKLKDYGIDSSGVSLILAQLERHGLKALGEHQDIDLQESARILQDAL